MSAHEVLNWLQGLLGGPFVFVLAGVRHQHTSTVVVVHIGDRVELVTGDPETARELIAALEEQQLDVTEADGRIQVDVN